MTEKIPEENAKALLDRLPMQRMGAPEEIAYWAVCLADPKASYMTGQVIHVNGGLWIG
jgi:3-oxoacyl-[acyl-carrier protein] reductase